MGRGAYDFTEKAPKESSVMLAIHKRQGSFSDKWISYCQERQIPFREVNAYSSNIIEEIKDCTGFMWHWHQLDYKALLFARQLTASLEQAGKLVYPSTKTAWHFDDKVGQKYLLESMGLPFVPSYCFYDKEEALAWAKTAIYPKVFKLRGGAGSRNVRLVRDYSDARRLINRAFSRAGFPLLDRTSAAADLRWQFRRDKTFASLKRAIIRTAAQGILPYIATPDRMLPRQKGYVYFQDFIPNNKFDDRLVVIGNRCFCVRRHCRKDDFRASGSGLLEYDVNIFPKDSIQLAFSIADLLKTQSVAIDFVYTNDSPFVVEISYAFSSNAYEHCHGYFDRQMNWHNVPVRPETFIIEDFLHAIKSKCDL